MLIKVKYFGKEFEVDLDLNNKVKDIKKLIEEKENIPIKQQRLIFSGKPMVDEKLAIEYDIKSDSVIYLTKTLSGLTKNSEELIRRMEEFKNYEYPKPEIGEKREENIKVIEVNNLDELPIDLQSILNNLLSTR